MVLKRYLLVAVLFFSIVCSFILVGSPGVSAASSVKMKTSKVTLAVNAKSNLKLVGASYAESIAWKSSNKSVAAVDQNGRVTGVATGETTITATITGKDGNVAKVKSSVEVTKPKLQYGELFLNVYSYDTADAVKSVALSGLSDKSTVSYEYDDSKIAALSYSKSKGKFTFTGKKVGTGTLKVTVDGKVLTCKINVRKIYFKRNGKTVADGGSSSHKPGTSLLVIYRGGSTTLALKGLDEKDAVKWTSSDNTIATVDSEGTVTGKGYGYATITAKVNGMISLTYDIASVQKSAAYGVYSGEAVVGSQYSQAKRMEKGYYDCSSFVWRSYNEGKFKLAGLTYAPPSADLGKALANSKCCISTSVMDNDEMLPGDLVFYSYYNNGRYKNITHVAMYVGNGKYVEAKNPSAGVVENSISPTSAEIVEVARPTGTAPQTFKVTGIETDSVTFKWSKILGADGYKIYEYDSKSKKYEVTATIKDSDITSCSIEGLTSDTTHKFKMRAYHKSSSENVYFDYTSVISVKTLAKAK